MEPHVIKDIERASATSMEKLAKFDSATVHEASGGKGALASAIKPLDPGMRVCGPAVTVFSEPGDNIIIHQAIYTAKPGDVLLVSAGGAVEAGPWGEIMAVAAQSRGIAGLVIDGYVRDSDAIIGLGFPVFSRGLCIKGTTKSHLGLINHPLTISGEIINPGDIVLGDRDGVVVVAREELEQVIEQSRLRVEKEEEVMRELRDGKSTLELYALDKKLEELGIKEA